MEFSTIRNTSKVWAPTSWELEQFHNNENINRANRPAPNYLNVKVIQEYNSIQTLIFKLTRKLNVHVNSCCSFALEDRMQYNTTYTRDYLPPQSDFTCAICNIEKVERNFIMQMQKDIEIKKMARNYFMQMDHCKEPDKICPKRNDFKCCCQINPNFTQTSVNKQPYKCLPYGNQKTLISDSDGNENKPNFCIPQGENPAEYMALNFDWVEYLKHTKLPMSRMPYTRNIKLEANNPDR